LRLDASTACEFAVAPAADPQVLAGRAAVNALAQAFKMRLALAA
jgi:hypothetical protein